MTFCPPDPSSPFVAVPCGGGAPTPDFDNEPLVLCDVDANGNVVGTAIAVYEYDGTTGAPVGSPTFVIPGTNTPYVVQGTLVPCDQPEANSEILCDIHPDGTSTQFIRTYHFSEAGTITGFHDATLGGAVYVPLDTVGECDPYSSCTPDSNLDLNAQCGPGEAVDEVIVAADKTHPLSNSVFVDDPAADPLCGGVWDNPAAALPPGFPVDETFRNATFDQPGPVTQANWPGGPQLTAGPPINDGAGNGWIRLSDGSYASNGFWQVPTPFSTAAGMNAAVTMASHDGTTPGGDGQYFVFSDGAAPQQSTPIGGFGNLGLNNIDGGVFAIVIDEYGQSCTCDHTPAPTQSPNAGPCGFCSNTISIQLAGAARASATCACCTLAQAPLAPKAANLTTRAQPMRLLTSVITEGGQTYVSASIDWNDGNGPVQYFDRVNITGCAVIPPTLRMGLSMNSGGAYQAVKEARDASARPAGESHWRAFPITTDPIPPCVTLITLNGSVDVTFNSDTQTSGNGDPEAYFWLVNEATNTVIGRAEKSSIPSQVGTPTTLKWTATVTPADIPNLRIYVGSESRDQNGEYDTLWENLTVNATGAGCPAVQRRTMEISARCPIPVTIVGGSADGGGGGGTTVVNTPSTFEDALVCIENPIGTFSTGFRREIHQADGTITVTFMGNNGAPILPAGPVRPGPCPTTGLDTQKVCDTGSATTLIARYLFNENGVITNTSYYTLDGTGPVTPVGALSEGGCCDAVNMGQVCYDAGGGNIRKAVGIRKCDPNSPPAFTLFYYDVEDGSFLGGAPTFVDCPAESFDFEEEVLCDTNGPFLRRYTYVNGTVSATTNFDLAGTPYVPVGPVVVCPPAPQVFQHQEILCDFQGAGDTWVTFIRKYIEDEAGVVLSTVNLTFAGTPYTPTGTVGACDGLDIQHELLCNGTTPFIRLYRSNADGTTTLVRDIDLNGLTIPTVGAPVVCPTPATVFPTEFDQELLVLCDTNGPFIRRFGYDEQTQAQTVTNLTLAGAAYVPVGAVGVCQPSATVTPTEFDQELVVLCDDNGSFIRRFGYDEQTQAQTVTNLTLAGAAYAPVGTVHICNDPAFSVAEEVLCDDNGSFIRRFIFNDVTGTLVSTTNFTLAGAPYAPVGTVHDCNLSCCPIEIGTGCTNTGSGTYAAIRNTNGTITLIDPVTGATVLPANVVTCPRDSQATAAQDVAASSAFAIPNTGGLVSWSVRAISGTVTLTINGTPVTMVPGETIGSAAENGVLTDVISISTAAASTARAIWVTT